MLVYSFYHNMAVETFFFSLSSFLPIVFLFTLRRFYFLHAPRSCHAHNEFSIHVHTACSLRKQPDPLFINGIFLFLPLLIGRLNIPFYSVLGFGSLVAPSALSCYYYTAMWFLSTLTPSGGECILIPSVVV